ncbi:MAG: aminomethyl-transferring glycine dehydrogenase [Paludibacteraceae bacterium]|nr:aminomethyl-transferring glycine dehydrogenase [Paludibacteraceae bacterium]
MDKKFSRRHIGITDKDLPKMLETVGVKSVDELIDQTIPSNIRLKETLPLGKAMTEAEYFNHIHELAQKNVIADNYIGMGFYGCETPAVILRNIFENPVWYTSYTPYQAEISQGRLEALLNYQTMICDITGLPLSNCSLLDEGTAAAEAVTMMNALRSRDMVKAGVNTLFVDENIFRTTLDVIRTRAHFQGINVLVGNFETFDFSTPIFGALVQYPAGDGSVCCYKAFAEKCHEHGALVTADADLLAQTILTPAGQWGADIVMGSTQRMGMPMYFGGPSAGYLACRDEYKRQIPGRIIGISKDANGKKTYRLALQSREQHIKREKALSNVCTAQALTAVMTGFYAAYHGNDGIQAIARDVNKKATYIEKVLVAMGCKQLNKVYFDTLHIELPAGVKAETLREALEKELINIRYFADGTIGISTDECTNCEGVKKMLNVFAAVLGKAVPEICCCSIESTIPAAALREDKALKHEIFEKYHTETEMMRYIKWLDRKDISLTQSMISLGSCTMKLNAAVEMLPLSWAEFQNIHPYAPKSQVKGYTEMIENISKQLMIISGFDACCLQGLSGAAGEYAGLLTIRRYHENNGNAQRNIILIPSSAHGTNPASAMQAGLTPVITRCDENGNVDVEDIRAKAEQYKDTLCGLMITYPSTHGIFEPAIREICEIIHANGGLVFMDGANMNGQIGLTSPGFIGADVCHLNLHKSFASPHAGGGPGVGPICCNKKLAAYIPSHSEIDPESPFTAISSAPYGNAGLLPITYGYISMMGGEGLAEATKAAILGANYLTKKLEKSYGIVYTGVTGRVGHEMILDCRHFKAEYGVTEADIAKRMMDYGYHAPTLSFPVHGTLMIEPTESESLAELDRFVEMMANIRMEIEEIKSGAADAKDNVLVNAPHPEYVVCTDNWEHAYGREKAAYPLEWVRENKFWVNVARVDDGWGDRNLITVTQD